MDDRILLAGIVPLLMVTCGCILIGYAYAFPFEAVIGLLLVTIPIVFLIWYILVRVEDLIQGMKAQGRVIHRAVEDQAADLKRRYEDTTRLVMDLNSDLSRRIYR